MAYGIVVNMKNKDILVVGGGKVACRKANRILEEGARVHMNAPDIHESCLDLQKRWPDRFYFTKAIYHQDHLIGMDLVIAATSDEDVNRQIHEDCRNRHVLCNNTSDSNKSDFWNMSTKKRFGISFFASSSGGSPGLTGKVLEEMVENLDQELLSHLEAYGKIRRKIRGEASPEERSMLLKKLMDTPLSQIDSWNEFSTGGNKHDD